MASGCSKHMTGNKNQFLSLEELKGVSKDLVIGLPNIKFKEDRVCEACAKGKQDADWVNAMQDELNQFDRSQVWHLVLRTKDRSVIGTKWVFRNKLDEDGTVTRNKKLYRGMIGSLLYLTASRPDIVFNVGLCARFQANPKESHLTAVKRILRYLKGTTDLCL
ncbi:uncharacterized protein [Nicotiana tomentosiformis]|uniref:uncharacterized protein n=1 Tax=Nicotiana tomentosiformis TaxID=4098 RepID=UPI00388CE2EB